MNRTFRHIFVVFGIAVASSASANITFYEGENFAGREITINQTVADFDRTGFNDRARSAIVNNGQWEVCGDANFSGGCQVLGPGRYPDLGALTGRVSSVRPASDAVASGHDGRGYGGGYGSTQGGRGGARATLYEGTNLSGRSFQLAGRTMANLDETGFNDRASSLRVERGYWIFCSDANFGGECRTFGPGDYASLPSGLDNRISSGRRIANDYPYSQNPTWQR